MGLFSSRLRTGRCAHRAVSAAGALLAIGLSGPGAAFACWQQAAQRHGVAAELLYAIAQVESNLNPRAINLNQHGRSRSVDIGLMQINSGHLPLLARHGVQRPHLLDPCTNIDVGAWLLAEIIGRLGNTWDAVGAYNAGCGGLDDAGCRTARARYAWKVYRRLQALRQAPDRPPPSAVAWEARPG